MQVTEIPKIIKLLTNISYERTLNQLVVYSPMRNSHLFQPKLCNRNFFIVFQNLIESVDAIKLIRNFIAQNLNSTSVIYQLLNNLLIF